MGGLLPPGLGLLVTWYTSLVYVGVLVGVLVLIWVYYDAGNKGVTATLPQAGAIMSTILMIPSMIFAISPNLTINNPNLIIPMGYIGLLGFVGAILSGLAYVLGIGVEAPMAPSLPPTQRTIPAPPTPVRTSQPRKRRTERTRLVGEQMATSAWLVIKSGGHKGRRLDLKRGANKIGRSGRKCDLVVEEQTVSSEHARIQFENGQWVIYDLASLNGTFVNGQRTQRQLLMDDDEIRLGDMALVFKKV